jgi:XTP/dITP diphosphohydrolase
MQKEWVIASTNSGKIQEIRAILAPLGVRLYAQDELHCPEIEETGLTFQENAILKARHAAAFTGLPALADDSGLSIDALHGKPGIYSARFAGPQRNYKDNIEKVLNLMAGLSRPKRTARFHCAIAFVRSPNDLDQVETFEGCWEGFILEEEQGCGGFGYDPIFFDPMMGCSAASLSHDVKTKYSHRGKALKSFNCYLKSMMPEMSTDPNF